MARRSGKTGYEVKAYAHAGIERATNPPVRLVTPTRTGTRSVPGRARPSIRRTGYRRSRWTFTSASTRAVVEAVRKRRGSDPQPSLFAAPEENPTLRQAIGFYQHRHNRSNGLIAGDRLLEKKGMTRGGSAPQRP